MAVSLGSVGMTGGRDCFVADAPRNDRWAGAHRNDGGMVCAPCNDSLINQIQIKRFALASLGMLKCQLRGNIWRRT